MSNQNPTPSSVTKVLDPECRFIIRWKRLMVIIGFIGVIIDPLFLYLPDAKGRKCLRINFNAATFYTWFRSVIDIFHLVDIFLKFRVALDAFGPKVFKTRDLIKDPRLIALNYLKTSFVVDLIAILPFPQMCLWSKYSLDSINQLTPLIVGLQSSARATTVVVSDTKIAEALGVPIKNVWSGAIYNLSVFILMGNYMGAMYYQLYLAKLDECLFKMFKNETNVTIPAGFDCSQLHKDCISQHKEIEHGMFSDAFANEIGLRSFIQKVIYCFVWGVRSLSSLGQIFDASFDVMETSFSCLIMILGLVWLADMIARMQTTVLSAGAKREKQRLKQRKLEEWTHYHDLPPNLKGLVRQSAVSEWKATKGLDGEAILNSLPQDLQRDIRTHLYKERVLDIPPFSRMDEQLLNFVCGHLRTFTRAEGTYIVLQGDPLDQVVFIFTGLLQLTTHHSSSRSHSRNLESGDFFGDDLLITWASQPNTSTQNLPPSNFTVKCITNVEAFCLPAEQVRLLVIFNFIQRFQRALRKHHA